MPANPSTAVQLNYKVGQAMVNIYAENGVEAAELNQWVVDNAEELAKTQALLDAAYNVAAPGGGQAAAPAQQQRPAYQQQAPVPQQGGAPQGDGGMCTHNVPRVFKNGTSKGTGKPWSAWMCGASVKGCEPVWNR